MCIAAWIWQAHPIYQLLLLQNRDEFHDRPTKPLGWWSDGKTSILGGRDGIAGGTWMGCTRNGRVAFITNVLEPDFIPNSKSRGDLPVRFLESLKTPIEFAEELAKEEEEYNGYNLVLADVCSKIMVYVSNRPKSEPVCVQVVSPGLHVLTNARLDTPWHKAQLLGESLKEMLRSNGDKEIAAKEMVEKLMGNRVKAEKDRLPNTGCDSDWEHKLSSIFVETDTKLGVYGTRSTGVLAVKTDGEVCFYEKYLKEGVWKEHSVQYHLNV
ncbi:transport and Golgi organization 2 homolog [Dioscorea cayenensis subsp. rotundata]|uniref:Transport and Golgi organization 2 homolog n=1 Tax=Dioscorea cayennensis subsp. rotundata TaxID=55577 RepID=A0AB40C6E0_DIOCR|nr:transport and Golgi organization 2 homolog [Dioscorea cayenensis subsp. rotundata]